MKWNFWIKIIVLLVVVSLFVTKGIPFFANLYLNANAEKIVRDMITRTQDFAGHEVHFEDIRLSYDYRGTSLQLLGVEIHPGDEIADKEQIRFNLNIDKASLTGFSWMKFIFSNSISVDSALIENAQIESISPPFGELASKTEARNNPEGKDYNQISANHLMVNKASFDNKDSYSDSVMLTIKDLFVSGSGFVITKEDLESPSSLFTINHIEGYMDHAAVHINEFRNTVDVRDLSFNSAEKRIDIDQVMFDNKLSKSQYIDQFQKEIDWIELQQGKVSVKGMDFGSYFKNGAIKAEKLLIEGMMMEVFRDKRKPENFERRPKMIHEIVRELPAGFDLEEIELVNGYVSYEERPENKAPRSGKIFFDQINASILGMTNSAAKLEENNEMTLKASGRLIGQGLIDLNITYFLTDATGKFLMNGSIGALDLASLNPMIEPATKVTLKQGKVNNLFFNIAANDIEGTGEIIVKYEGLEIEILDKDFGFDQNIFQKIGSFLANKLIIKSENPDKNGELKKGEVYYLRDQHKFIFNYWWKLILSGLKSTLTGDTEEDLRKKAK